MTVLMKPEPKQLDAIKAECSDMMNAIYSRCFENAPNFGVGGDEFCTSLCRSLDRFLTASTDSEVGVAEAVDFLEQIQADDLFLAIACANGNERAWWEFDQQHRGYIERVARHLAKTEVDAQEVIDTVYVELYGTRVVDGERVSKFSTFSGRGSLRGWLRTVIWHSLVDLHRASHDEVSLDEMTEKVGEGAAQANFADSGPGGEDTMIDHLARERYRVATVKAIEAAFGSLDEHEKLLLLYYHVENLKLREIARLVENEDSPLRGWFQRRSSSRESGGRTHESTVMRWLEKCYARVQQEFRTELQKTHGLAREEVEICVELATRDLTGKDLFANLSAT
jgi:RNA polymerase sigma-70 factor